MNNTAKIGLLIVIVIVLYLLFRKYFTIKKPAFVPTATSKTGGEFSTTGKYSEVTIPNGSVFSNAEVTGYGARFFVTPINGFDSGRRNVNYGSFKFTDAALQAAHEAGNNPPNGTMVGIKLTNDLVVLVPNQEILIS